MISYPSQLLEQFRSLGVEVPDNVESLNSEGYPVVFDWIRATLHISSDPVYSILDRIVSLISPVFSIDSWTPGKGYFAYAHSLRSSLGISISYSPRTDDRNYGHLCLEIPGSPLAGLDFHSQLDLLRSLLDFGFSIRRLDLALDICDFVEGFSISQLFEHCNAGNCSGFRTYRRYSSNRVRHGSTGDTLYLGSRQADKLIRIYEPIYSPRHTSGLDIPQEIKADIHWHRIEAEFKKNRSDFVARHLLQAFDDGDLDSAIKSAFLSCADFILRKDYHLDRAQRLPFWGKIFGEGGKLSYSRPKKDNVPRPDRAVRWTVSQIASTLLGFRQIFQENFSDFLDLIINFERDRLRSRRRHGLTHVLAEFEVPPGWVDDKLELLRSRLSSGLCLDF